MSALRYSGDVRVRVTYFDPKSGDVFSDGTPRHPNGSYCCRIVTPGVRGLRVFVGAPAHLEHAVDSPEAFDCAARAALAFADEELGGDLASHCEFDDAGVHVRRMPR